MKYLSPEAAFYLYKSTVRPCMEYCCHVWADAPSFCLDVLDKLQKRIYRTVGPSPATFPEPLAHRRNIPNLGLFYKYYFGGCYAKLAELFPLPHSRGMSSRFFNRYCITFMLPFLEAIMISMSTVFLHAQLGLGILCL